jgi:hypothetical protein
VKDVGCGTDAPRSTHDAVPRFYSRYVFLNTVTALQLLWGYFSFALWNYFAHIRWYGASVMDVDTLTRQASVVLADDDIRVADAVAAPLVPREAVQGDVNTPLYHFADEWLAVAYLAFALAGLTYTVSAVLYVCVVNTPCHVRAAWPYPQLFMKACCPISSRPVPHSAHERDATSESDNDPFTTYAALHRPRLLSQPTVDVAASCVSRPLSGAEEDTRGGGHREEAPHPSQARDPSVSFLSPGLSPRRVTLVEAAPLPVSQTMTTTTATPSRIAPLNFTQPQFLFPLLRLGVLDRAAVDSVHCGGVAEAGVAAWRTSTAVPPPASFSTQALTNPSCTPRGGFYAERRAASQRQWSAEGGPSSAAAPFLYGAAAGSSYAGSLDFTPLRHGWTRSLPPQHRGDPKAPLLWCAFPLVIVLVIFDFMVIRGCHVRGWPVRLVQGLTPALGLLLLLYTLKSVVVLCIRCCVVFWTAVPMAVYAPPRPPLQPGGGPTELWIRQ